jgi:hypothetical protein
VTAVASEGIFFAVLLLISSVALFALTTSLLFRVRDLPLQTRGYGFWSSVATSLGVLGVAILGLLRTVLHVGTSAERRSAFQQKASEFDLTARGGMGGRDFPAIPRSTNLLNSPGTVLAYRLPVRSIFAWRLLGVALYAILWSGLVSMVGVYIGQRIQSGEIPWITAIIAVPVLGIAIRAIMRFFAEVIEITGLGPTSVEVSDLPFFPGQRYEVAISQAGWMTLRSLDMTLVCEEEATFRQGTDVRTERRTVFEQRCFEEKNIRIQPQVPLERQLELVMPEDAMHSFQSGSNAITWKLVARGRMKRGACFERTFPLIVFPSPVTSAHY